jgi:hypothetical protein
MIENCSDRDLNELYENLIEYKTQYFRTYQGLRKVPFIRDLFSIVEDQWAYRNQMEEELVS